MFSFAIQNIFNVQDENIRVVVNVNTGEIIEPDEYLIWSEYEGLQGHLCRNDDDENAVGIICELFILPEDGVIHTEEIPMILGEINLKYEYLPIKVLLG